MIRIIKTPEPIYWIQFKKHNPKIKYDMLGKSEEGKKLKEKIKGEMTKTQKKICCYCCRWIKEINSSDEKGMPSHIEHIKPQKSYPMLSMNYDNMLVSCSDQEVCGMKKGHMYDPDLFVSPLESGCEEHFIYEEDGMVKGVTKEGIYTIQVLNLNSSKLKEARKQLFKDTLQMAQYAGKEAVETEYINRKEGYAGRFVDMVLYFYKAGYYDEELIGTF